MKIKTICPTEDGGCGKVHYLEVENNLDDPELKEQIRNLAALVGCRPCSIYQISKLRLEDVQLKNKNTIWEQEQRRDNAKRLLTRNPPNRADLETRITDCDHSISCARGDLHLAIREMQRLEDARSAGETKEQTFFDGGG